DLFGRDLPPVASGDVTFRYWRPKVDGRRALLVGLAKGDARFCRRYRVVARIAMPVDNEERGRPIARCTLDGSLAAVWPRVLALRDLASVRRKANSRPSRETLTPESEPTRNDRHRVPATTDPSTRVTTIERSPPKTSSPRAGVEICPPTRLTLRPSRRRRSC